MTIKNNIQRLETYNSYSGCDMVATAQISSHSALKDKVYTLGSIQTISISTHQDKRPVRSLGNINAKDYTMGQRTIAGSLVFAVFDKHFADQMFKDSITASDIETSTILLSDELPPFDITISYANEYGHASKMRLYGVRLVNEGQVMSINDIYTENTYQFVATGLEPLSKEELNGSSDISSSTEDTVTRNEVTINNDNDIKRILDFADYNFNFNKKEDINLSVKIEQPLSEEDYGIVNFYLSPDQSSGTIKIFSTKNHEMITYDLELSIDGVYYVMLPIDNYYAYYESDNKLSNTVDFAIYHTRAEIPIESDMPIIEYATNNSICIISNNKNHIYAVCQEMNNNITRETQAFVTDITSKKATFSGLKSNTYYSIYTTSDIASPVKSQPAIVLTLSSEDEILKNFATFVSDNKDLLIYDIQDYMTIVDNLENDHNIIDSLLKYKNITSDKEALMKQELLLYSIKLQNIINNNLNKNNPIQAPEKDIKNAFTNTFEINKNSSHVNLYRKERGKNYFETKIINKDSYTHNSKNNIKYSANHVTSQNIRSCNYEFCCFDYKTMDLLSKYTNTNKLSSLNNAHNKMSSINSLKELARNYKKPGVPIIQRPIIKLEEDLTIYVDISYFNQLPLDINNLKVVVSTVNECLDTTPHIKIRLNKNASQDNLIKILQSETGIQKNKSYALWIEEETLGQISYCETIDTYFNNIIEVESLEMRFDELEIEVNKVIKHIKEHMKISSDLYNCINAVVGHEDTHISNLYDKIIEAVIENQSLVVDMAYLLYLILSSKHKLDPLTVDSSTDKVVYNRKDSSLTFEMNNYSHLAILNIDSETGEISKQSFKDNNNGFISLGEKRFIVAYKVDKNALKRTGFVLIDQASKEALSYKMKVEVI